mgnify:CR=1 FL=1
MDKINIPTLIFYNIIVHNATEKAVKPCKICDKNLCYYVTTTK